MRTARSFLTLVAAMLPILYIGGLLFYLNNVRDRFGGLLDGQISPTMFGLAAIGLVFVLLFALKLWRHATPPAAPRSAPGDTALEEPKSDFDADAALARYMARRAEGGAPPANPGSFGRKRG